MLLQWEPGLAPTMKVPPTDRVLSTVDHYVARRLLGLSGRDY